MPTHLLLRSCQGAAAQGTYLPFILLPPFHFPNPSCMEKPKTKHTTVRCHWSSQVPVGLTYPDLLPATSPLAHAQSHPRYVAPSAPLGSGPCHEHLGRRLVLGQSVHSLATAGSSSTHSCLPVVLNESNEQRCSPLALTRYLSRRPRSQALLESRHTTLEITSWLESKVSPGA